MNKPLLGPWEHPCRPGEDRHPPRASPADLDAPVHAREEDDPRHLRRPRVRRTSSGCAKPKKVGLSHEKAAKAVTYDHDVLEASVGLPTLMNLGLKLGGEIHRPAASVPVGTVRHELPKADVVAVCLQGLELIDETRPGRNLALERWNHDHQPGEILRHLPNPPASPRPSDTAIDHATPVRPTQCRRLGCPGMSGAGWRARPLPGGPGTST